MSVATGQRAALPLAGSGYLGVSATAWGLNWPVMKLLMRDRPPHAFRVVAALGAVGLLAAVAAGLLAAVAAG